MTSRNIFHSIFLILTKSSEARHSMFLTAILQELSSTISTNCINILIANGILNFVVPLLLVDLNHNPIRIHTHSKTHHHHHPTFLNLPHHIINRSSWPHVPMVKCYHLPHTYRLIYLLAALPHRSKQRCGGLFDDLYCQISHLQCWIGFLENIIRVIRHSATLSTFSLR